MTTVSVPLTLSYDTRGEASYTSMQAGKDQRRVNCQYKITRTAVDTQPDIALSRRPGVTTNGLSYGTTTQSILLVGKDPAGSWEPTPWAFVKDGSDNKVCSSSTSVTILSDATYFPRFVETTNISGSKYAVVQLQHISDPIGATAQKIYYAQTINGWTQMTLNGIVPIGKMEHLDGYGFVMDDDARIYQTSLNALTAIDSSSYITLSSTENFPSGLVKHGAKLLGFSSNHVELFRNAGNASGSVLERVQNSESEIGMHSMAGGAASIDGKTSYYCRIGDLTFFVGRYGGSTLDASLIAFDGNRFVKISKPYEDTALSTTTLYSINAGSHHGSVFVAIQTTAPTATTQKWLAFYPDINEWFEFESARFGPVNNGLHFAGCASGLENKLYFFPATEKWTDSDHVYTTTVQFRVPHPDLNWKTLYRCGLIADSTDTSQVVNVSFSRDDGRNWSTARPIDLTSLRKEIYRCGTFREMMVRITHATNSDFRIRRWYGDLR
jgi:hypothetical protein